MNTQTLRKSRLSIALLFLTHGLVFGSWFSRIPDFQSFLQLSPSMLGQIFLLASLCSIVAIPTSSYVRRLIGRENLLASSTVFFCLVMPFLGIVGTVTGLCLGMVWIGLAAGAMNLSLNTYAVALEASYRKHLMASLHAFFSIGGMIGSLMGGVIVAQGVSVQAHFFAVGALALAMGVWSVRHVTVEVQHHEHVTHGSARQASLSGTVLALALVGFCVMLSEGAMADWIAIYLKTAMQAQAGLAASGYAAFSGAMAIGRLTGDWVTTHLGRYRILRLGTLLGAAGLAVALLAAKAELALVGFAVVGCGFATVVPNVMGAAGSAGSSRSIAVVSALSNTGFLVGPPVIGFLADIVGIHHALWLLVALSLTAATAVLWLERRGSHTHAHSPHHKARKHTKDSLQTPIR